MATYPEVGSSADPSTFRTQPSTQRDSHTTSHTDQHAGGHESVRDLAADTRDRAADQARDVAGQVKEQARTQLAGQKERATEQLGGIKEALHQTSQSLRDNDQQPIAEYVDRAAQQVDHLNHYLRNHTVSELLGEAERYARREPALFLGAAAFLGLAAARFFRASEPSSGQHSLSSSDRAYRSAQGTGGYSDIHGTRGSTLPRTPAPSTTFPTRAPGMTSGEGRWNG